MKVIAVIPARYNSTRFQGKLLKNLGGKSIISRTYNAVKNTNLFDDIIVATDHQLIKSEIEKINGKAVMTSENHQSGSDRIAEAVKNIDADIIVNIQGDEPFTQKSVLEDLIKIFKDDTNKNIDVASAMFKIQNEKEVQNPNYVKVVVNEKQEALYFSRSAIPFNRDNSADVSYYKHIGIYAYRKKALLDFTKLPEGTLENIEKLEQLRYLENGYKIKMTLTNHTPIGIDTPEDLELAEKYLKNNSIV